MGDEIKIHEDRELLSLGKQWNALRVEETGFLLNKEETNRKGRTMTDVAKDMIDVYSKTNGHLKNIYPNNEVAKAWIATNNLGSLLVKEIWL